MADSKDYLKPKFIFARATFKLFAYTLLILLMAFIATIGSPNCDAIFRQQKADYGTCFSHTLDIASTIASITRYNINLGVVIGISIPLSMTVLGYIKSPNSNFEYNAIKTSTRALQVTNIFVYLTAVAPLFALLKRYWDKSLILENLIPQLVDFAQATAALTILELVIHAHSLGPAVHHINMARGKELLQDTEDKLKKLKSINIYSPITRRIMRDYNLGVESAVFLLFIGFISSRYIPDLIPSQAPLQGYLKAFFKTSSII
ncbi:hypothetical protein KRX56_00800 [Dermabacteraceae bacterium TAE3-ERU27]|nr:hypothetical protein [Dermabacteraceae bacterium TAE3-ERU27]